MTTRAVRPEPPQSGRSFTTDWKNPIDCRNSLNFRSSHWKYPIDLAQISRIAPRRANLLEIYNQTTEFTSHLSVTLDISNRTLRQVPRSCHPTSKIVPVPPQPRRRDKSSLHADHTGNVYRSSNALHNRYKIVLAERMRTASRLPLRFSSYTAVSPPRREIAI